MARCTMCFQDKTGVSPPYPGIKAGVCRGCYLQLDRALGWLELAGQTAPQFTVPILDEDGAQRLIEDARPPQTPPEAPETPAPEVKPTKKR